MIIKSTNGKTIYQSIQKTARGALEEGVAKNIDFAGADFRRLRLSGACLDGIKAKGAAFWAAEMDGADIGLADLRGCDLRCANLKDACLAESDLSGADLRGAYFAGTIVEEAVLDRIQVSCPTFWTIDLESAQSMEGAVFLHHGEVESPISPQRWFLKGGTSPMVLNGGDCFWRGGLYRQGQKIPVTLLSDIERLRLALNRMTDNASLHDAKRHNPKSENHRTRL